MIEQLTRANGNPIIVPARDGVRVFPVETDFHRMARRPGGVSRQQALRNVQTEFERFAHRLLFSLGQPT
jgi:endonuclease III